MFRVTLMLNIKAIWHDGDEEAKIQDVVYSKALKDYIIVA